MGSIPTGQREPERGGKPIGFLEVDWLGERGGTSFLKFSEVGWVWLKVLLLKSREKRFYLLFFKSSNLLLQGQALWEREKGSNRSHLTYNLSSILSLQEAKHTRRWVKVKSWKQGVFFSKMMEWFTYWT